MVVWRSAIAKAESAASSLASVNVEKVATGNGRASRPSKSLRKKIKEDLGDVQAEVARGRRVPRGVQASKVAVGVAIGRVVAHRIGMLLVLHDRILGQAHDGSHRVADLHAHLPRVRGAIPDGEDVLLVADREDAATDLVTDTKLTAEDREHLNTEQRDR